MKWAKIIIPICCLQILEYYSPPLSKIACPQASARIEWVISSSPCRIHVWRSPPSKEMLSQQWILIVPLPGKQISIWWTPQMVIIMQKYHTQGDNYVLSRGPLKAWSLKFMGNCHSQVKPPSLRYHPYEMSYPQTWQLIHNPLHLWLLKCRWDE